MAITEEKEIKEIQIGKQAFEFVRSFFCIC